MAAPKGNKFWLLRSKHGRDKIFVSPKLLWEAACEYFEWAEKNPIKDPRSVGQRKIQRPFTIEGLCVYVGANTAFLRQFEDGLKGKEDAESKDFSTIIGTIKDVIFTQQYENAAIGVLKENIVSRKLGLADKQEVKSDISSQSDIDYSKLSDGALEEIAKARPGSSAGGAV